MRRTLMLDEDDLVMVVKEDVVKQIDENRGELNRTEFVNYLIQYQLKDHERRDDYVAKEDFLRFTRQITGLLNDFLQFFVSYGMSLGKDSPPEDIRALAERLESLPKADEENQDW
jgi:hypothetical protein